MGTKLQLYNFNNLGSKPGIYAKIDYLTIMFYDCSLNDVLHVVKMDDCVNEFALSFYEKVMGFDTKFVFSYNGVMLETGGNYPDLIDGSIIDLSCFDRVIPKIRFCVGGSALDYLRSLYIVPESHFKQITMSHRDSFQYQIKRVDWAYDFINYCPSFMDECINHCVQNTLASGRLPILNLPGGISVKLVTGNQKTIYLGSNQSDRMLRIYDKRMEQSDLNTGTYVRENPYDNPDSWFRIEWQTRNSYAHDLYLSDCSMLEILRLIFDKYAFANEHRTAEGRAPVEFWDKLFDWQHIKQIIIQNAKSVQFEAPSSRVCRSFESTMIRTFMLYYTMRGPKGLEKACTEYIQNLYNFNPVDYRRLMAMVNKINELGSDINLSEDTPGLYNCMNRIAFKL